MDKQPNDPSAQNASQRNADAILDHLREYLSIRFDMVARVNSRLRAVKQDLIYHELANVQRCLCGTKIYGPVRMCVADVFLSDDETRRRNLMSSSDQTSVQVELVSHCHDERSHAATRGQIKIHDLKSYYASVDPTLADFIDLFETWIWWDIFDAVELVRFERKLGMIRLVRQGRMTPALRRRYGQLIHGATAQDPTSAGDATDEEIVVYETELLQKIHAQWTTRRSYEHGYMFVLKRDEVGGASQGELIHRIAEKVREYDRIESQSELNEEMAQTYAAPLRVTADKVTRALVLNLLEHQLVEIEREMLTVNDEEARLGPPYDYKQRQLEQMGRWLGELTPAAEKARETSGVGA